MGWASCFKLHFGREASVHGAMPFGRPSHPGHWAVEAGLSRNAAARWFGVSIASAVRWMDEYLRTCRAAPKQRGGDRRLGRIEAQAELLLQAIEEAPDVTLAELRELLIAERGETVAISTIHAVNRPAILTPDRRPILGDIILGIPIGKC